MPQTPWPVPYRIAIVGFVLTSGAPEQVQSKLGSRIEQVRGAATPLGWDSTSPCLISPIRVPGVYMQRLLRASGLPSHVPEGQVTLGEIGVANAGAHQSDFDAVLHILKIWFCNYVEEELGIASPFGHPVVPGHDAMSPGDVLRHLVANGVTYEEGVPIEFCTRLRERLRTIEWGDIGLVRN